MASIQTLSHRVAVFAVALVLATGPAMTLAHAQSSKPTPAPKAADNKAADKKKATEKKKDTAKRDTTQNAGGSAPMSGFLPDPVSNY